MPFELANGFQSGFFNFIFYGAELLNLIGEFKLAEISIGIVEN
jgi:hypothetical protein